MSHPVMILDDDYDLRTTLADMLGRMCDASCLVVPDLGTMIEQADQVLECEVAFVDINLGYGQPSGVDAFHWLLERGFKGRIVFLTGHAHMLPPVEEAVRSGRAVVVEKPASLRQLCGILDHTA